MGILSISEEKNGKIKGRKSKRNFEKTSSGLKEPTKHPHNGGKQTPQNTPCGNSTTVGKGKRS